MGRELKRVALDFDWPMNIVWKGYLTPYRSIYCKLCDGSGYNKDTDALNDSWYDSETEGWHDKLTQDEVDVLVAENRLYDFTHVWTEELGWVRRSDNYVPSADEVNAWQKNARVGHDSCNKMIAVKARATRMGVYGLCKICSGNGHYWADDKYEKLSTEWKSIEPPDGDGFQMWETCSEGSPISPVFKSAEELCEWLANTNASSFGSQGATYEQWLKLCKGSGWAPSMIITNNKMYCGAETVDIENE